MILKNNAQVKTAVFKKYNQQFNYSYGNQMNSGNKKWLVVKHIPFLKRLVVAKKSTGKALPH